MKGKMIQKTDQQWVDSVHALNELAFSLICEICKNDCHCIFNKLMASGLDKRTLGFWVLDIPNNIEFYSPGFRKTLGFEDEKDFPNVPESWQKMITPKSKDLAISNFEKHVQTRGKHKYVQPVVYYKKGMEEKVFLICAGAVVSWIGDQPKIMVGLHMEE